MAEPFHKSSFERKNTAFDSVTKKEEGRPDYTAHSDETESGIAETIGHRSSQQDAVAVGKINIEGASELTSEEWSDALKKTAEELQDRVKDMSSGSCLLGNVIVGDHIYTQNVGDSTAFLIILNEDGTVDEASQLNTRLHNVKELAEDDPERQRIIDEGGRILFGRVNGALAVTRAMGDKDIGPGVGHEPDIYINQVKGVPPKKAFLITACDGLTEKTINTESIANMVADQVKANPNISTEQIALSLVNAALKGGSGDNISVVVTPIDPTIKTPLFVGVFDGHGESAEVSETLENHYQEFLEGQIRAKLEKRNVQDYYEQFLKEIKKIDGDTEEGKKFAPTQYQEAIRLLKSAAENNSKEALCYLAYLHLNGSITDKNGDMSYEGSKEQINYEKAATYMIEYLKIYENHKFSEDNAAANNQARPVIQKNFTHAIKQLSDEQFEQFYKIAMKQAQGQTTPQGQIIADPKEILRIILNEAKGERDVLKFLSANIDRLDDLDIQAQLIEMMHVNKIGQTIVQELKAEIKKLNKQPEMKALLDQKKAMLECLEKIPIFDGIKFNLFKFIDNGGTISQFKFQEFNLSPKLINILLEETKYSLDLASKLLANVSEGGESLLVGDQRQKARNQQSADIALHEKRLAFLTDLNQLNRKQRQQTPPLETLNPESTHVQHNRDNCQVTLNKLRKRPLPVPGAQTNNENSPPPKQPDATAPHTSAVTTPQTPKLPNIASPESIVKIKGCLKDKWRSTSSQHPGDASNASKASITFSNSDNKKFEVSGGANSITTHEDDTETFRAMIKSFKAVYGDSYLPNIKTLPELADKWNAALLAEGYKPDQIKSIMSDCHASIENGQPDMLADPPSTRPSFK